MPLPKPVLDVRTFDQLVAEGRGQIPKLASAWTDFNYSDPGITLLDLFSWLAEQDFYRFDRVSAEMLRGFLRLVGVVPRPPQVASTVLLFATKTAAAVSVPDRLQIANHAHTTTFETTRALTISPAAIALVLAGDGAGQPGADVTDANRQTYDETRELGAVTFLPFGPHPRRGSTLTLCFDAPLGAPGADVSLHVWTLTPERDAAERNRIVAEWEATRAAVERDCPSLIGLVPDWTKHYSVDTVWEFHAGPSDWRRLEEVEDETRALTLSGFVRFKAPAGHTAGDPAPFFAVRCRIVRGWFECPPRLDRIDINAVAAEHAETLTAEETLGASDGHARQIFSTARAPIVPRSTALTLVKGTATDAAWTEVPYWDETGAHDRHYLVEYDEGRITAGDGMRAAVPPTDWELRLSYRVGGGPAGNAASQTLVEIPATPRNVARVASWSSVAGQLTVDQLYNASGGEAAEPLPHAQARAIEALAEPRKAVTLADFVTLARRAPGLSIARAYGLADHYPLLPCSPAPGHVTVIVVPDCAGPRPTPGPDLLRAVEQYLERRRLITTAVHVVAPRYVEVSVGAVLHPEIGANPAETAAAARRALDEFFDPLHGGPEGAGWPAGRGVYRTEVMALLSDVPGVLRVTDLTLTLAGDPHPRCANVEICPTDLVASGTHHFTTRAVAAAQIIKRSVEHECP